MGVGVCSDRMTRRTQQGERKAFVKGSSAASGFVAAGGQVGRPERATQAGRWVAAL